ncbi:hypothetical protein EG329_003172 [Mollisiaceae sp. DMI_Dod_QoI]|nr:hypothetical protein EG329_003172 [Helotiales sp. DMI_Dod_QoI]
MARYVKASGTAAEEGTFAKIIHVPGLILTTIISTVILVVLESNRVIAGNGNVYHTITKAQTTTQQVVTVTASILGVIHANAITKLINQATRIILAKQPTSVHRLKLWYALSTVSLDRSVRWTELPLVIGIYFALSYGPSFLWSGAIAPVQTVTRDTHASIALPQYTDISYRYWAQNAFDNNTAPLISPKGTFTYLPILDRLGYLIVDGSSATTIDGQPQVHSKNDNSNYTYIGRSYGVGSSVGLSDGALENTSASYKYNETGYHASVDCMYNKSSQFRLLLVQPGATKPKWIIPYSYLATGWGPEAEGPSNNCTVDNVEACGGFIVEGLGGDQDIVAAGWWGSAESGHQFDGFPAPNNYIGKTRPGLSKSFTTLAAGSGNPNLNNVQCSISMIPTSFTINVDIHSRKLSVTVRNDSNVADIEPTGFIADSAASVLGIMSSLDTSFKTSILSSILTRNINNKISQQALSDQSQPQDVATLQGIAESIETLIDDSLLATASAQLMIANDYHTITPTVYRNGLRIGEKRVVVTLVIVNALIVVLFIEEALRTRNWNTLPKFDYSKIESIIVATSLGGSALGDAVLSKSSWVGGDLTEDAGDVKVIVSQGDHVQLRIADGETEKPCSEDGIELLPGKYSRGHSDEEGGNDDEMMNERKFLAKGL